MTPPVGGERHERAVEAALRAMTEHFHGPWPGHVDTTLNAYFASLAEQGVRLVEQPKCPGCDGSGRLRHERDEARRFGGGER